MGQAQMRRQRDTAYTELELWDLDDEWSGRSVGGEGGTRRNSRGRTEASRRNHMGAGSKSRAEVSRGIRIEAGRRNCTQDNSGNRVRQNGGQENGSGRNIRLYEQRQRSDGRGRAGSPTGRAAANRRPARELQVQDIRRYQGAGAQAGRGARSAYAGDVRPVRPVRRRKARRRKVYAARAAAALFVVLCLAMICILTGEIYRMSHRAPRTGGDAEPGFVQSMAEKVLAGKIAPPAIMEEYLEVNDFSRPGTALEQVNSIFVHYTANPGTSAAQNRSYFANLALTQERSASAHFIIGYDGEIVQCIPLEEQAYAVMTRNEDSISIECCYTSEDGSFTRETYDTLVHTLAWLVDKYHLSTEDILRHYDCGGKLCPVYYVEHEDEWERLLRDVAAYEDI